MIRHLGGNRFSGDLFISKMPQKRHCLLFQGRILAANALKDTLVNSLPAALRFQHKNRILFMQFLNYSTKQLCLNGQSYRIHNAVIGYDAVGVFELSYFSLLHMFLFFSMLQ